jgi:hypothetical protein
MAHAIAKTIMRDQQYMGTPIAPPPMPPRNMVVDRAVAADPVAACRFASCMTAESGWRDTRRRTDLTSMPLERSEGTKRPSASFGRVERPWAAKPTPTTVVTGAKVITNGTVDR